MSDPVKRFFQNINSSENENIDSHVIPVLDGMLSNKKLSLERNYFKIIKENKYKHSHASQAHIDALLVTAANALSFNPRSDTPDALTVRLGNRDVFTQEIMPAMVEGCFYIPGDNTNLDHTDLIHKVLKQKASQNSNIDLNLFDSNKFFENLSMTLKIVRLFDAHFSPEHVKITSDKSTSKTVYRASDGKNEFEGDSMFNALKALSEQRLKEYLAHIVEYSPGDKIKLKDIGGLANNKDQHALVALSMLNSENFENLHPEYGSNNYDKLKRSVLMVLNMNIDNHINLQKIKGLRVDTKLVAAIKRIGTNLIYAVNNIQSEMGDNAKLEDISNKLRDVAVNFIENDLRINQDSLKQQPFTTQKMYNSFNLINAIAAAIDAPRDVTIVRDSSGEKHVYYAISESEEAQGSTRTEALLNLSEVMAEKHKDTSVLYDASRRSMRE